MHIEFLGTGGAITTPKPLCGCRVCLEARRQGVPYSRLGPSLFVHGPDVLIDTPEEIKQQLNRSEIQEIAACFYSHWHPDHTLGRRVWEMNRDWRGWPRQHRSTDIYLPERVARDFRQRLGTWEHLTFLADRGLVRIVELADGTVVELRGHSILPLPLAEDYVYAFVITGPSAGGRQHKALIVPDEIRGWDPPPEVRGADLAVIPMGVLEFDPFSGERRLAAEHPILQVEATFRQALQIAARLEARRIVMTHIEEPDGLSYDDLERLERQPSLRELNLTFAYDTQRLAV